MNLKKVLCAGFFIGLTVVTNISAMTDNAGVLGGVDKDTDVYSYLNSYPYHLVSADHRYVAHDLYASDDNCVLVDVWDNRVGQVFLVAPGYTTNKGISVGMTFNDVVYAYGKVYRDEPADYREIYGVYDDNSWSKNYSGYGVVEYVSPHNEGLNFIFDKSTGKVVLIMYQSNRHGNSRAMAYVEKYKLLPYKR